MNGSKWYAVWTRSHCERLVAQQLTAKGFAPFLPEAPVRTSRTRRSGGVQAPLFPGYVFVNADMDKGRYINMLSVRGIVRVLEDGWTRLTPIPDAEIEAIQRVVATGLPILPFHPLQAGQRVCVVEGPLSGLEGTFISDRRQSGRLVLSIGLLGRSVSVEVDDADVTPCATRA